MAQIWKDKKREGAFWRLWHSIKHFVFSTIYFWAYRSFFVVNKRQQLYAYWSETMMLEMPIIEKKD
jgi:hypothetical protein